MSLCSKLLDHGFPELPIGASEERPILQAQYGVSGLQSARQTPGYARSISFCVSHAVSAPTAESIQGTLSAARISRLNIGKIATYPAGTRQPNHAAAWCHPINDALRRDGLHQLWLHGILQRACIRGGFRSRRAASRRFPWLRRKKSASPNHRSWPILARGSALSMSKEIPLCGHSGRLT